MALPQSQRRSHRQEYGRRPAPVGPQVCRPRGHQHREREHDEERHSPGSPEQSDRRQLREVVEGHVPGSPGPEREGEGDTARHGHGRRQPVRPARAFQHADCTKHDRHHAGIECLLTPDPSRRESCVPGHPLAESRVLGRHQIGCQVRGVAHDLGEAGAGEVCVGSRKP